MSAPPSGNLAIVTGASSGIGQATARLLAQQGFRTILIARRAEQLALLATELGRHARSLPVPLDMADPACLMDVLGPVLEREGSPNVLVNCAGFGTYSSFLEQSSAEIDLLFRVNFHAPANLIRAMLPGMREQAKQGKLAHIVNVSSISARIGPAGHAGYSAAKAAMRSLTETLQCEYGGQGLNFTVVYPGIVKTEFFTSPDMAHLWSKVAKRAIPPERVARAIVSILGKRQISLFVPAHYRMLDLIAAISPNFALGLVRSGSKPPATD